MASDDFSGDISVAHDFFNANFDSSRYKTSRVGDRLQKPVRNYVDGSDYLANRRKMMISFQHAPSGRSIFFKSFITAFNETYNSDWVDEKVFGRVDPIMLFKNTSRRITLAFKVPAGTESEAYENLVKLQHLAQFLYPNYKDVGDASTISQSPLIRLKVMNLAQKSGPSSTDTRNDIGGANQSPELLYEQYRSNYQSSGGLLGAVTNVTINHNLEAEDGAFMKAENTILPKLFEVNLEFAVIHEQPLGWKKTRNGAEFQDKNFPYNAKGSDPFKTFAAGKNDVQSIIDAATPPQARIDNAKAKKNKAIWGLSTSERGDVMMRRAPRKLARAKKAHDESRVVDPYADALDMFTVDSAPTVYYGSAEDGGIVDPRYNPLLQGD